MCVNFVGVWRALLFYGMTGMLGGGIFGVWGYVYLSIRLHGFRRPDCTEYLVVRCFHT
jgi:hypothetical protein